MSVNSASSTESPDNASAVSQGAFADDPEATFWTRALWLAETTKTSPRRAPLVMRKRAVVLRGVLEHEAEDGGDDGDGPSDTLRVAWALHALALKCRSMPPESDILPSTIVIACQDRLAKQFRSSAAAIAAIVGLGRRNAVRVDWALTDCGIRKAHAIRRHELNRARRRTVMPQR